MIYDWTQHNPYDVKLDIDSKEFKHAIENRFPQRGKRLILALKQTMRDTDKFNDLLDYLCLDNKEFVEMLVYTYPEVLTNFYIKFIKENIL